MPNLGVTLIDFLQRKNRERLAKYRQRKRQYSGQGLAVLATMKNESTNLDEWMTHYFQVGADRIVLIDNGSTDDSLKRAEAWLKTGKVEVLSYPAQHRQLEHYWAAYRRFVAGRHEWLLIADMDEFWFCPDGTTIAEKLADPNFDCIDVIYANWRMFGSSGLVRHPESIRIGFVHCAPRLDSHKNTKFICRASALRHSGNLGIHKVKGADSSRTVSDNEAFHLNHYPIQSREFFQQVKMTRGDALSRMSDTVRDMEYFRRYDEPCILEDRTLSELVKNGRLGAKNAQSF